MNDINSDVECDNNACCNVIQIDSKRLPNLFRKPVRELAIRPRPTGDDINKLVNNIVNNDYKLYGITVNILPFKSMNKKRWFTYSHDKQRDILSRVEHRFRKDNPSVILHEIHYEICPTEGEFHNIHFHALYEMPELFVAELTTYYDRICFDKSNKNWRHLDIKLINNKQAWIKYITKDLNKN